MAGKVALIANTGVPALSGLGGANVADDPELILAPGHSTGDVAAAISELRHYSDTGLASFEIGAGLTLTAFRTDRSTSAATK